jgi:hypothetical protein
MNDSQAERRDMGYDPFGDVKGFLSGGSIAAKFPKVGAEFEGTVISFRMAQRTHIDSGEPLYWEGKQTVEESELKFPASKNNPAMQLVMEVQGEPTGITWDTNRYIEREVPDDDGVRTLYITGNLQRAFVKALRDAGGADVEPGAYVKVVRGNDTKAPGSKYFSYTYAVTWTPADKNTKAATDFVSKEEGGDNPFAD